jgi:hypothetical protein
MRIIGGISFAVYCFGLVSSVASAQTFVPTISLKSGESTELMNLYWTVNCRSVLKRTPEVEIIDGPPQVSATIREAMVTPRTAGCAKPVSGGILVVTAAKEIEDPSSTRMTLRIKYAGKDGNRQSSLVYDVALFP